MSKKPVVLVGMSGGVDSSVSAALLVKRGYRVIGGFIKNWSDTKDAWTGECSWRGDRQDALRVAARLGIPLQTFDFEDLYRSSVVDPMFRAYEQGITPNPDVLCNEIIKFGAFFRAARSIGADMIATGHYARIRHDSKGGAHLLRGTDPEKDQSYFLHRVPQDALRKTMFPIGGFRKSHVRALARKFALPTAERKESMGICFIGKQPMKAFLRSRIPSKPGEVVNPEGAVIGSHDGLDGITIGQRHGFAVQGSGAPWYAASKDVASNRLVAVQGRTHPLLYAFEAHVADLHWIAEAPKSGSRIDVVVRYRQEPVRAVIEFEGAKKERRAAIRFTEPVFAVAPGQSAVLYRGAECLGGGVII